MKTFILLITLCLSITGQLPAHANSTTQNAFARLYIDNIHIVDIGTGKIIINRQLQIDDGKITAIRPAQTPIADPEAAYHDGKGVYAMPGLVDMHVHAFDPVAFTIALSHGVTHLRLMNGVEEHLTWQKELEEGRRIGSTLTVSSPIISSFKDGYLHHSVQTPLEASEAVIQAKRQGYDLIKAYGNLSAPVLKALLREARQQQIPVAKHGPHPAPDMAWDELVGLQSLEHAEDIFQGPLNYQEDRQKLDDTIIQLKALNTPVTPTLNIFWQLTQISEGKQHFIDSLPEDYISPIIALETKHNQVKRWLDSPEGMVAHNKKTLAFLQEITHKLYLADIPLLIGSDSGVLLSPHGIATHKEMELMQQAGVPTLTILRAATINAGKALGKESRMGQIAIGYNADLMLSEHNPLENLSTLQQLNAVVKSGRLFSKTELEQLRKKAIDERSFWQEMDVLRKAW